VADSAATGPGAVGWFSPGFVGRDRELAGLGQALACAPAVVLVEGEAGVGKTRLLREFTASPAGRAHRILVAECPPFRQPHTLGALVDAVRRATRGVAGFRLSALAGALRPLFPEWAADLPPAPEPAEDATAARHRVFRALAELLSGLGVSVLAVEDGHWADEATLEFLLFARSQVSLVVTYRPEDVPAGSLLLRLSSRPLPGATQLRLTLGPLDAAATASLVSSMLGGGQVSAEFAGLLYRWTDGLPLAVEELVKLMHDRAGLALGDRGWIRRQITQMAVPPTLRDAVLERAARLTPDTQAVLRAAAVLGEPATDAVLIEVTGLPPARARTALAGALGVGMLTEAAPGLVAYRHMLAARAVHQAVPAPDRGLLHLRAARALERQSPRPTGQLARHYREAGDTPQWCRYGEQAADEALAAGDEAAAVVVLHDLVTRAQPPPDLLARLAKKIPLGTAVGLARCQEVAHALQAVLDAGIADPAGEASMRVALARVLRAMHADPSVAQLEQAIPHLDRQSGEAAWAMIMLSWPGSAAWPASVHLHWLRRAAQMPLPAEPADRLRLIVDRAAFLLQLGEQEGWAVAAEMPPSSRSAPERRQLARGHHNIGEAAVTWGRYEEARRRLAVALDLSAQSGYTRLQANALVTQAYLDWLLAAWDGLPERAAALAADEDLTPVNRLNAALVTGLLHTARGPVTEARDTLLHVLDQARQPHEPQYYTAPAALARLLLAEGRVGDALDVTGVPIATVQRKEVWVWATEIAPARVAALAAAGRTGEAARLVTAFARGMRGRKVPAPRAALALCRAILAEGTGDRPRAAALYSRAAAAWQALPRPYDALLASERHAACLLADGQDDAALPLLTEVFHGLASLGARPHADRIAQQLREHGREVRPVARRGRRGYGDQLSPRELDVVRLVINGQTNKEIAHALARSPRTVGGQLSSAMRKFGVSSRTALAVRAAEADISPGPPSST
jgi:DNA-binding CsgD family transcriptional regulator